MSLVDVQVVSVQGNCKLRWTKSAMVGVHFCTIFSVINIFITNMFIKNHFFARTILCSTPNTLLIIVNEKISSNSKFSHLKWLNEFPQF
jgi:hypothetical protein